jgi:hypothetical protein
LLSLQRHFVEENPGHCLEWKQRGASPSERSADAPLKAVGYWARQGNGGKGIACRQVQALPAYGGLWGLQIRLSAP